MSIDFLLERFEQNAHHQAIIWHNRVYIYKDILELFQECQKVVASIEPGKVVAIEGDFSPGSVAVLLALMANDCIVVPLTQEAATQKGTFFTIAEVEYTVAVNKEDSFEVQKVSASVNNPLIISLRELGHPGLILFSSGSTGKPKGILHDWVPILKKYQAADRKAARILSFLLFDHIGGLNTLWHTLSSSGCIIPGGVVVARLDHGGGVQGILCVGLHAGQPDSGYVGLDSVEGRLEDRETVDYLPKPKVVKT